MPERRTIWLRGIERRLPVVFYQSGKKRQLVIAGIMTGAARGYLIPSPDPHESFNAPLPYKPTAEPR
jgi:hypothetical protein